ncbi:unnamed protein product [Rotaria sordida]|uniref:Uncharacterized protein n=1 Tax=Rotaria sordida TaxID=392033 RepID=A0A819GCI5_9BILA|nr:unnamed protein product [Rotaria sordida]
MKYFDHNRPDIHYSTGDQVIKRISINRSKLAMLYSNAMTVIKEMHPNYFIQDPTEQKIYQVHVSQLRSISSDRFDIEEEVKNLCDIIKCATDFIFDTESAIHSHIPALIQVLIVQEDQKLLLVLLIETTHLPDISSLRFREIQKLFQYLFRTGTNLYSWGSLEDELTRFQIYQLFSVPVPARIFNVQYIFTKWFNEYINKKSNDNNSNTTDNDDSVIINAPEIDSELFLPPIMMNHLKVINNELWSLQDAIAYIFYKHLLKRETLRSWYLPKNQITEFQPEILSIDRSDYP